MTLESKVAKEISEMSMQPTYDLIAKLRRDNAALVETLREISELYKEFPPNDQVCWDLEEKLGEALEKGRAAIRQAESD
jgi:hypothetical protein